MCQSHCNDQCTNSQLSCKCLGRVHTVVKTATPWDFPGSRVTVSQDTLIPSVGFMAKEPIAGKFYTILKQCNKQTRQMLALQPTYMEKPALFPRNILPKAVHTALRRQMRKISRLCSPCKRTMQIDTCIS